MLKWAGDTDEEEEQAKTKPKKLTKKEAEEQAQKKAWEQAEELAEETVLAMVARYRAKVSSADDALDYSGDEEIKMKNE